MTNSRDRYPFHRETRAHYTGEHVAAMMRAREAHALRQRKARRVERFYMLATIAGLVAVAAYMFHQLTN